MKRRQDERARELEHLQDRLKDAAGLEENPAMELQDPDKDYFMTQVEQEEAEPEPEEEPSEAEPSQPQSQNQSQQPDDQSQGKFNFFRPTSYKRPAWFKDKSASDSQKGSAISSAVIQRNYSNRLGPKALLQIDSRWNCVPKYGEPLNEREH